MYRTDVKNNNSYIKCVTYTRLNEHGLAVDLGNSSNLRTSAWIKKLKQNGSFFVDKTSTDSDVQYLRILFPFIVSGVLQS